MNSMKCYLGCLIVSFNGREILEDYISQKKISLNIDSMYQLKTYFVDDKRNTFFFV